MTVLYVSSFNEEIYKASGKNLLQSFAKNNVEGAFCVGYEGFEIAKDITETGIAQILCVPLDNDVILEKVFLDNIELIPEYISLNNNTSERILIGELKVCNCKKPWGKREDAHIPGCKFTWWNRNFIRWFRKVLTLYHAKKFVLENESRIKLDYIVWVDSDAEFINFLPESKIKEVMGDYDTFYMKGRRKTVETGIVGFNLNKRGGELIGEWLDWYLSERFKELERFDDGYVYDYIVTRMRSYKARDIISPNCRDNQVARHSKLSGFIQHNKGLHGRVLGIMK